jgi:hypothetical protein
MGVTVTKRDYGIHCIARSLSVALVFAKAPFTWERSWVSVSGILDSPSDIRTLTTVLVGCPPNTFQAGLTRLGLFLFIGSDIAGGVEDLLSCLPFPPLYSKPCRELNSHSVLGSSE